jgi:hypothetical protein
MSATATALMASAAATAAALTIETSSDAAFGTGGNRWGGNKAGFALLDLLSARGALAGASIVALGSGAGVLELVAAALGARVLATDLGAVLPLLARNVAANARAVGSRGGSLTTAELAWGGAALPAAVLAARPSIVLASDCVYWPELFAPLIATLRALSDAQLAAPPHVFFTLEPRSSRELAFFEQLDDAGFEWAKIDENVGGELDGACSVFWARRRAHGDGSGTLVQGLL